MSGMDFVFSVQDETGTVYQLTIAGDESPSLGIEVGDTGTYSGLPDDGTAGTVPPITVTAPFTVSQVLDNLHFSISTTTQALSDWPASGTIHWLTGALANTTSTVTGIDGANAYISEDDLRKYASSRGISLPSVDDVAMQTAIVQATDYLDQKYKFRGTKLVQQLGNSNWDSNAVFLQPWLTPYALNDLTLLTPSTSTQSTEWPRQGAIDNNGNTINGIPRALKFACAELAIRVLNGTNLQPDYDPNIVGNGGVVSSVMKEVGPLRVRTEYDTKLGLGFFASFPHVDRMLAQAGLLNSGRGRVML
jgi:hypothetical protein